MVYNKLIGIELNLLEMHFRGQHSNFIVSDDQRNAFMYVSPSHLALMQHSKEFQKLSIPITIAVTPFPRNVGNPSISPYNLQNSPKCRECSAFLNKKIQNSNSFLNCPICGHKNSNINIDEMSYSTQLDNYVFDMHFPENRNAHKNENIPNVEYDPSVYLLVIECSEETLKNGLFQSTIQKMKDTFMNKNKGVISVFIFNSNLYVPFVLKNNKSFSISSICDLENITFPPPKTMFFDLSNEKDLFSKYLDFLLTFPPSQTTVKLFDIVKSINQFCGSFKIPVVIVTSTTMVGNSQEFRDFAIDNMRNTTAFKFFCVSPSNAISKPDFSPITELSLLLNSKMKIFSQSQIYILPSEIIQELFEPVFFDVIVYSLFPENFKIFDIKGSGLRRSGKSFYLPYISLNDTIYIYLEYGPKLTSSSPAYQIQVRYLDESKRNRFARSISSNFIMLNNFSEIVRNINFDVFLASTFVKCVDKARENDIHETANGVVFEEFEKVKKDFYGNEFFNLFFHEQKGIIVPQVNCAFSVGKFLLNPDNFSSIMGRNPDDISRFVSPICFKMFLNCQQLEGPIILKDLKLDYGAAYIKLNNNRALILLHQNEDIQKWTEAIQSPPLDSLIAQISEETVVEIVSPQISQDHNLYKHLVTFFINRY
ncbi:hypothetical protein TRFO_06408 [Tritrichomonas foetus]|uniref:Sec23/Sec24 trunk domain containing protein n=1 Tax=Tritrichomonas foetus TaxID=1144522 RepID=A0A1J4K2Z0_9EUKA|nr:hypothetical protein TRFO_06408 [Tritrichomonas foetus]|eukprot:OHT04108.1 hypothetical protein TRFO_06408 [Tritrichomonas foetus]